MSAGWRGSGRSNLTKKTNLPCANGFNGVSLSLSRWPKSTIGKPTISVWYPVCKSAESDVTTTHTGNFMPFYKTFGPFRIVNVKHTVVNWRLGWRIFDWLMIRVYSHREIGSGSGRGLFFPRCQYHLPKSILLFFQLYSALESIYTCFSFLEHGRIRGYVEHAILSVNNDISRSYHALGV